MDQINLISQCMHIITICHKGISIDIDKKIISVCPPTNIAKDISEYKYIESFNFGFFETIIPYLSTHDILVLFMTSKNLRVLICNRTMPKDIDLDSLLLDIIDSRCTHCKFLLKDNVKYTQGGIDLMQCLFMLVCKKLDIIKMKDYFNFKRIIKVEENHVHECVLYSSKRNYEDRTNLFTYISDNYVITNLDTIKIICNDINLHSINKTSNGTIINNIAGSMSMCFTSNEIIKYLLPYLCDHSFIKYLSYNTFLCNFKASDDNYMYLLNLINDNQYIYSSRVISILLGLLIIKQKIDPLDIYNLIKLTCTYGDEHVVSGLLSVINRNAIYSELIPMKDLLQTIIDTDNAIIKSKLILYIDTNCDLSKFTQQILEIIIWVVNYEGHKYPITNKLMHLKFLDEKLKILLSPTEYIYHDESILEFLDDSEKLNEISIKMAMTIKNWPVVYCSHLNNDKLFEYIDSAIKNNKYNIALVLILHININDCKHSDTSLKIFKEVDTIYSQVQNIRPPHYVYDESSYAYKDSKVICKYKLKVLDIDRTKLFKLDYIQSLLQNNPHHYCEIFEKIISGRDQQLREYEWDRTKYFNRDDREKLYSYSLFKRAGINIYTDESRCRKMLCEHNLEKLDELIIFMINHKNFSQMKLVHIIFLLNSYISSLRICYAIIKNYNFFNTVVI